MRVCVCVCVCARARGCRNECPAAGEEACAALRGGRGVVTKCESGRLRVCVHHVLVFTAAGDQGCEQGKGPVRRGEGADVSSIYLEAACGGVVGTALSQANLGPIAGGATQVPVCEVGFVAAGTD